jgi:two-component system, LytTR family, response regulator
LPNTEGLDRILVRTGRRIAVVRVSEIDWIEASGDYVSLHVKNDVWLLRETAGEFARRYAAFGIRRIHRSTLVNVDRIVELRPLDNGEYTLVLRDGSQLKLSRSYRHALSDLLSNNR